MSWSLGYDNKWNRDIGYGVPAICDHPGCNKKIDRGLSYVCGGEPYGGEEGCGLYFCAEHLYYNDNHFLCNRCLIYKPPFEPKPDSKEWIIHKLTDLSWEEWRKENPNFINKNKSILNERKNK